MGESAGDPYYRILLRESEEEIKQRLEELKAAISAGRLRQIDSRGLKTLWFRQHLYDPLLYLDQNIVEITPVPLNKGERRFVEDLQAFHDNAGDYLQTIKEIERRLGDPDVSLHSFIISNTPSHVMATLWGLDKPAMAARHILFQEEDQNSHIRTMLAGVAP